MGPLTRPARWLLLAVTLLVMAALQLPALAGDDDDLVDPRETAPGTELNALPMDRGNFSIDTWVFGDNGDETAPEVRLLLQLRTRVREVARIGTVSKAQQDKLFLAGEGDVRRFINRVEELKLRYPRTPQDGKAWQQALKDVQPLQGELRNGLFGRQSLFGKTMAKMLSTDESISFAGIDRDRRRFQHRAGINMTVLRLSTALGLSDEQQTRLKALLLKETRAARLQPPTAPARFFNVIYTQMGRIPEAKLKPLFEPWQWQALRGKIAFGGNFDGPPLERGENEPEIREPPPPARPVPRAQLGGAP
jgi:hypothetical protein